jgi:hypothetical protein
MVTKINEFPTISSLTCFSISCHRMSLPFSLLVSICYFIVSSCVSSAGEPDPFGWAQSIIVQQAQSVAQTRSRQSVCEPRASSAVHVTAPLTVPSTQSLVELEAPKIAPPLPPRKPKPLVSKVPAATTTTVSTELP